jgi:type II secretory pathway pseudopilin PulG
MKKIITFLMAITILAAVAVPSFAQGRGRRNSDSQSRNSRNYDSRSYDSRSYDSRSYSSQGYYDNSTAYYDYGTQSRGSSIWNQHRDKLTVGAGTVGGAILGGLIGGRRGAAIGALAGAGGSALYTYKLRNRGYRY